MKNQVIAFRREISSALTLYRKISEFSQQITSHNVPLLKHLSPVNRHEYRHEHGHEYSHWIVLVVEWRLKNAGREHCKIENELSSIEPSQNGDTFCQRKSFFLKFNSFIALLCTAQILLHNSDIINGQLHQHWLT